MITRTVQTHSPREHPTRHRRLTVALAAFFVPLLLAATATTASANPPDVEQWSEDFTVTFPDGSETFCGDLGFDVVLYVELEGIFVGTRKSRHRITGTTTWSNPESGREFRIEYSVTDRDQVTTDNDDGTLTIQIQQTGHWRYYVDGALTFINTGMTRFSFVVDLAGTPTDPDDDEIIDFLGVDKDAGPRQFVDRDICDIGEFIG